MNEVQNSGSGIAYRIWGSGSTTIVIDTALGTCSAEWWHIAEKLSEEFRVVTFDRLGCGRSKTPTNARTPQNIAAELDNLLASLGIDNSITLLGHSQGGFYSMQYALMYPSKVTGMVLLDPATPYDNEFAKRLSKEQYKQSGVDKTLGLRLGKALTSLKLGFMFKPLLKKMPPFYYYDFSKDAKEYLLKSLCRKSAYAAALDEYKFTHMEGSVAAVKEGIDGRALGDVPIRLITHSSEIYCKELQKFGNMDAQTASFVEKMWQGIMKKTLNLSSDAKHIVAPNSGHFIHLTDFDVVYEALVAMQTGQGSTIRTH